MSDEFGGSEDSGIDEDPPIYRSGRVRIIGAEPAGNAVHAPTGPVVEEHPDMQHWNDAPTGQVPAILDRSGDEPALAPPTWREEATDWAAHEELFEPSMLSDDQPAVGSMVNDNNEQVDMERQPWHFDPLDLPGDPGDEDTLFMAPPTTAVPTPTPPPTPAPAPARITYVAEPEPVSVPDIEFEPEFEPRYQAEPAPTASIPSPVAASRLSPPTPPQARTRTPRSPRTSRLREDGRNVNTGGTGGRNMQVAIASGVVLFLAALLCFKAGNVGALVISTLVVLLCAAEAFAAFRRAQYHPATLLGLVASLSLMVETYNKGVSALPLILAMLVAVSFIWYLAGVEKGADPIAGLTSTVFVFTWIGGFGSFAALIVSPSVFPDRHGVAFLLAAILTTAAADVGGLLVGSSLGRHPLAPSISPNKSWEGLIGGLVASLLIAAVVVHFIHPWTLSKALILGLVVGVIAPLGDLGQSMIKRQIGVKDMSRLLPGHGGILDRFDGLLFVLPATYFVVKALHLG
ncbi:MAG TPA: phosphatidate cytidylyltransferase [Acidimicrobiales bacterium]|jgi:CDP-diglyceride synthetase|nr:phosphatidate cytidylyltransferase [Acidimicrobiales bacterium]